MSAQGANTIYDKICWIYMTEFTRNLIWNPLKTDFHKAGEFENSENHLRLEWDTYLAWHARLERPVQASQAFQTMPWPKCQDLSISFSFNQFQLDRTPWLFLIHIYLISSTSTKRGRLVSSVAFTQRMPKDESSSGRPGGQEAVWSNNWTLEKMTKAVLKDAGFD